MEQTVAQSQLPCLQAGGRPLTLVDKEVRCVMGYGCADCALLVVAGLLLSPISSGSLEFRCPTGPPSRPNRSESPLAGLRKDLLCRYQRDGGPSKDMSVVSLSPYITRRRLDIDEETSTVTLFGYLIFSWTDEFLTWDKAKHNVTRLYALDTEVWTPKFVNLDAPKKKLPSAEVLVMNGTLLWTLLLPLQGPCQVHPYRWPADTLRCVIRIMNLTPNMSTITHFNFGRQPKDSIAWKLTETDMELDMPTHVLTMSTSFERVSALSWTAGVAPWPALGLLLLGAMFLSDQDILRPVLLCIVVLMCTLSLSRQATGRRRPPRGEVPAVVKLQAGLVVLAGLSLPQWLLVRKIRALVKTPSAEMVDWISRGVFGLTIIILFGVGVDIFT